MNLFKESHRPSIQLLPLLLVISLTFDVGATLDFDEVSLLPSAVSPPERADERQVAALKQEARLTVLAPKYLRPGTDYHVLISLANSRVPATVDLQLVGARDSNREQTEAKSVLAHSNETQTVKFSIGSDWPAAEYLLQVSALATDRSWNFTDERPLVHQAKSFSCFIQTDKAIYKPAQVVQFRALFLTPNLTPLQLKETINVSVQDARNNIIKQWDALSNYRGLLSLELALTEDPILGDYTIRISTRNQEFVKSFTVAEYVLPTYEVRLHLPSYATYNESDIVASVRATYTYGKPVQGHVTLTVQPLVRFSQIATRPLKQAQFRSRLNPDGTADFALDVARELDIHSERFERDIEFFALVEEDLTGRKYNQTELLRLYENSVKIERLHETEEGGPSGFKPGMSQLMQYKVAYQDDVPVEDNGPPVELRYEVEGQQVGGNFSLQPRAGLIEHELRVPAKVSLQGYTDDSLTVVPNVVLVHATYRGQTHTLVPLRAHQSESHQYLQIQLPQLRSLARPQKTQAALNIGDMLEVRVQASEPMQQVTCQGFARGDIVWALSRNLATQQEATTGGGPRTSSSNSATQFQVKLEQRMAPQMRILCFHVREQNKELIADSISLAVGGLVRNSVKLAPSHDEAKPGQEIQVGVFTRPNALVGLLALDQSVLLLKSGNDLSQPAIMEDLKAYGSGPLESSSPSSLFLGGRPENTASLLEAAQVVVMSNNLIYNGAGTRLGHLLANSNILQASPVAMAGERASDNIELDRLLLSGELEPALYQLKKEKRSDSPIRIRSLFPETWLWQNGTADERGQARFAARLPDTITSWQLSAFSMSESHGLALSSGRTSVRAFRPFFVKLNLPYAIIRGESVSIQAIVFNYSKRPVQAKVTLDNRGRQFEFVEAANSVEDERHSSADSQSRLVSVAAESGASVSFLVKPNKLGWLDVRVLAQSATMGDGVLQKLLVKPEGQVQHMNRAMLIQLNGTETGQVWRRNVTIEIPANAVEGSQKVSVSAIGDLLGAGLSNVDDLLRLPCGCGEQNMINLVPNLVILNYLESTGRLRAAQRERATRNLETGYQRQLNYKRADGSFSAFGADDSSGSAWLTAYVLKTLQQARSLITVDERVLERAADFLSGLAQADGSIKEVGMLHNRQLASSAHSTRNSIYLTAYTMIALLQVPAGARHSDVIDRGLDRLERHLEATTASSYELAIVAYALQLAGGKRQEAADRAYQRLWGRAHHHNDQTWWSFESAPDDETVDSNLAPTGERERESFQEPPRAATSARLLDTPPPLKPLPVKGDQSAHLFIPESLSVEQTAWALLTAARRRDLERALPVVRWLVGQQNSNGGFASTQDTVLAIEALASYAEAVALSGGGGGNVNNKPLSLDLEFIYPRNASLVGGSLRRTHLDQLLVRPTNALVQQQIRLAHAPAWVEVQASGSGLAVVQVSWQYNLLVSAERPAFYLNPVLDRRSNINYLQLSICTYYKGLPGDQESAEGRAAVSNMAVVEVELPSGYVADMETLAGLKRHKQIKRVDAAEAETRVLIYLERVGSQELCFTVPAHRSSRVSNNRPVPVTIYDYYDRKRAARIFYEPQPASSCDICESDTCSAACVRPTGGVASNKLISLHEQRKVALSTTRPTLAGTGGAAKSRGKLVDISPGLTSEAAAYLPLASAFSALVNAVRRPV